MLIFTKLLLAHLIGDFLLQPTRWIVHKEANKVRSKYLYIHVMLHFVLTMILLWDLQYWKLALIIAVSHSSIDLAKLYATPLFRLTSIPLFMDQVFHFALLHAPAYYG